METVIRQKPVRLGGKEDARLLHAAAVHIGRPDKYAGKRKKTRARSGLWLDVRCEGVEGEPAQVSAHDISCEGVSFWIRKEIEPGQTVMVRDASGERVGAWLKVRITHCVSGLKGFLVGGFFDFAP